MIDSLNTIVPPHDARRSRLFPEPYYDNLVPTPEGKVLWRAGGFVFVKGKLNRRCVRGIPLGEELWLPGDGRAGEPTYANDNVRGGRYPLQEEYKAGRLGKFDEEGDMLWSTAKWFGFHYDLANREPIACSYGLKRNFKAGDLGGYVDAEENEQAMGSTDPIGYQIEIDPLSSLGGVDPSLIEKIGRGESELEGVENRVRSIRICQHAKYRLDCNYRHVVDAVVNRCEMKAIGMAEGVKEGAAAAGRMLARAGLRTLTLVRSDIARWEAQSELGEEHTISPLSNKPDVYSATERKAANDDVRMHMRDVA